MGILRTDKISGLETPTAVTGSVAFDGSGDYLQTPDSEIFSMGKNDYTIEGWFYFTTLSSTQRLFGQRASNASQLQMLLETNASGQLTYYFSISSSKNIGGVVATKVNTWHHIAVVRKDLVHTLYVDGVSVATNSTDTGSLDDQAQPFSIGRQGDYTSNAFNGHISNFRICKGTAVYTSDFTVPTHALEVTQDTVLLCCNNPDSVTASEHGAVGADPPILTANGDPTVSSINPGLTRDFTSGTEFRGVTTFDTQGYFVPPSGTTEQRGRGRGLFGGGDPGNVNTINYITIASMGNAFDFGDLSESRLGAGSAASTTRAVFAGGYGGGNKDTIDFVTVATTGNAVSFGELFGADRHEIAGASSSTRALFAGGSKSASPNHSDEIDYVTIASLGDAQDFGNLTVARRNVTGFMSPTRAVFCGGRTNTPSPSTQQEEMDYVTIATTGNALDFGDLTVARGRMGSVCSSTRGVVGGGEGSPADSNVIDYVTIASLGDAQDFGDMITASDGASGGCSNSMRGVFGGHNVPGGVNTMEYITISSSGNSQDFGDLLNTAQRKTGCSDSHGGLS